MSFGQLDHGETPQPLSEINMTPLVDVMLVLLIIFIVTAPLLTHNIKISLPKANTKASTTQHPFVVSLDRNLNLYLDNAPVTRETLRNTLQLAAGKGDQPTVELHADGTVAYQDLIQIMALAQNAGITKLSFVTEASRQRIPMSSR